jgi:Spy/CpxP family protein refolding chaperone
LPAKTNFWTIAITAVAGLLIGFAASTLAYRYRLLHVPGGHFVERMNRELNLTPVERDQIFAIMSDTRRKAEDQRSQMRVQRRELFVTAWNRVRAVLNPEQQKIFDRDFSPPRDHEGAADSGGPPPGHPPISEE